MSSVAGSIRSDVPSDDTTSDIQDAPSPGLSAGMLKTVIDASVNNKAKIAAAVENNLELQFIVLATIAEYEKHQQQANVANATLMEMVVSTIGKRKRHSTSLEDDDSAAQNTREAQERMTFLSSISGKLRRGQFIFGDWNKKNCDALVRFCDEELDWVAFGRLPLEDNKKAMEVAFELKMHGDMMDRIGTDDCLALCQNLKIVYENFGRRLQHMEIDTVKNCVNWETCAPWFGASTEGDGIDVSMQVSVYLQRWASPSGNCDKVTLDDGAFLGDNGPFELVCAFSVQGAHLMSLTSNLTYTLADFIPAFRHRLARRPSDEVGATNVARQTYQQVVAAVRLHRSQSKATRLAMVPLLVQPKTPATAASAARGSGADVLMSPVTGQTLPPPPRLSALPRAVNPTGSEAALNASLTSSAIVPPVESLVVVSQPLHTNDVAHGSDDEMGESSLDEAPPPPDDEAEE